MTSLSAELIEDAAGLRRLEEDWRRLAVASGSAFLTPEWYRAWEAAYGEDSTPFVIAVRRETAVVGVIPLVRTKRRLRFAGASLGDRFHPAAAGGDQDLVASVAGRLLERDTEWRTLVLDNVDADAAWPAAVLGAAGGGLVRHTYRDSVLPLVDLREFGDWEDYLASRSRNLRSQLRRYERTLERDHALAYRSTATASELEADLAEFFRLHDARWSDRGGSTSASGRARLFHRQFAASALEQGWLRLWFLELGGERVAAWYGWSIGATYAYYLAGFDPARKRLRPGHVLLAHTIRAAIAEGTAEYDLLLGDEPYKQRFATGRRTVQTLLVSPRWHASRLAAATEVRAWRLAQRLSPAARRRLRSGTSALADRMPGHRGR